MSTLEVNTIDSVSGTSTLTVGSSNSSAISLAKNVSLASGVEQSNFLNPAFRARMSGAQSITCGTYTKVDYDTEFFDTDSAYDNSTNYRFTPQTAGKYFIFASVQSGETSDFDDFQIQIHKNGSTYAQTRIRHHYGDNINCQVIVDMNGSTDYVEGFVYQASGSNLNVSGAGFPRTRFGGFRVIGV